jgi:hypothetical protein
MNSPRLVVCLATLAVLAGGGAATAESPRRQKPIVTPAIDQETLIALRFDADVYAASADTYTDMRVLASSGDETPYVIRLVTRTERRAVHQTTRVAQPEVRPLPGNGLEIIFRDPRDRFGAGIEGITLLTPLRNFEHRVTVAWSPDGRAWQPLVENALIYDYARFMDVRERSIPLPAAPDRDGMYRVVIDQVTQAQESQLLELTRTLVGGKEREVHEQTVIDRRPFRIDGIDVSSTKDMAVGTTPVLTDVEPVGFHVVREPDGRATRVSVEARREPITELAIMTPDRNFSRRVRVERAGFAADGPRAVIAHGTITLLDVAGIRRKQLAITVPETRATSYDIVIDDGDSPPVNVTGITASGPVRELVFLAKTGIDYRLMYGGVAAAPRYDTAAIDVALSVRADMQQATLGSEAVAPDAPLPPRPLLADSRVQIAIIALLAIALGFALFRAAKRIDGVDGPDAAA